MGSEHVFQLKEWARQANEIEGVNPEQCSQVGDEKLETVRAVTNKDAELVKLCQTVRQGWPTSKDQIDAKVRSY